MYKKTLSRGHLLEKRNVTKQNIYFDTFIRDLLKNCEK